MAQIAADEDQLTGIVRMAVIEALEQRPEIFQEAVREVLEDFVLAWVMEGGTSGEYVDREEVWKVLEVVSCHALEMNAGGKSLRFVSNCLK